MHDDSENKLIGKRLRERVKSHTGQSAAACYQCGKCTAGCPLYGEWDFAPSQILRMLQTGIPEYEDTILNSYGIWLCLSCETCAARCPKEVEIPEIMDYLRAESLRLNLVNEKAKDIVAFHESFLASLRRGGRLHEISLVAAYKMKTGHLFQDVANAPKMISRGKLKIFPEKIKGSGSIKRIFEKVNVAEEAKP